MWQRPYCQRVAKPQDPGDRWWQFLAYRRRYVSDVTWFGLVIIVCAGYAVGLGWRLLFLLPVAVGFGMVAFGIKRGLNRTDAASGTPRPGPPW